MPEGRVSKLPQDLEPGVIKIEKRSFFFVWDDVIAGKNSLTVGEAVRFNQIFQNGKQFAQKVVSINIKPQHQNPLPLQAVDIQNQRKISDVKVQSEKVSNPSLQAVVTFEKFTNPYNFIPLMRKVERREPESHEYFINKRGRITCQITFKTPFFLPHPEKRDTNKETKHETLHLLKDHNSPIIPGASLKGAIRSVAEVLSSSCMSIIDLSWELMVDKTDLHNRYEKAKNYYSYRIVKSPKYIGKIIDLPTPSSEGEMEIGEYAKIFFKPTIHSSVPTVSLSGYQDKKVIYAKGATYDYRRGRSFTAVDGIPGNKPGILKITDITDAKLSQRFYWSNGAQNIALSYEEMLRYNRSNALAIENDRNLNNFIGCELNGKTVATAGKRGKRHKLEQGDIVYFNLNKFETYAEELGPVMILRKLYKHSLDEILFNKHTEYLPCNTADNLCPCCRTFGWVNPSVESNDTTQAHKGFIHFSQAKCLHWKTHTELVTLKPLGQPHPSCWQFYLNCKHGEKDKKENEDCREEIYGYNDEEATIRGRKFYWHQPGTTIEAVIDNRKDEHGHKINGDSQNKTVELLEPGAQFEFTVDFENLSDEEAGMLLLSLQPNLLDADTKDHDYNHHFGMGKPLGMGSAELKITKIEWIDSAARYNDLFATGVTLEVPNEKRGVSERCIKAFIESRDVLDTKAFKELEDIKALYTMLDFKKTPQNIQYPPGHQYKHHKEYQESFHWFTHVAQRDISKPKEKLPLVNDDTNKQLPGIAGLDEKERERRHQNQNRRR